MRTRVAFVCDTPLQLYNCICVYWFHMNDCVCDLFLADGFFNSSILRDALERENIFGSIFYYKKIVKESAFDKVRETLLPKKCIESLIYHYHHEDISSYNKICVSMLTHMSVLVALLNPDAEFIFFEDGIGNYTGNIGIPSFIQRRCINKILHRNSPDFYPSALYVNNPDICICNFKTVVHKLCADRSSDDDFNALIMRVFQYHHNPCYARSRFVYLTQPIDNYHVSEKEIEITDQICELLLRADKDVVLRKHPRDTKTYDNGFRNIDTTGNLWELICENEITENHVLIGLFSTAQLSSKLIYDKEPYLIFLYYLYRELFGGKTGGFEPMINKIKELYTDKRKVIVLNDLTELERTVEDIKNSNNEVEE